MIRYAVDHHDPKSERLRKRESVTARDADAQFRFACVVAFREAVGTLQQRVDAVSAAIQNGLIAVPAPPPGGALADLTPSPLSLKRWDKKAGTPPSIENLRDRPRSGRPRLEWSPAMQKALEDAAGTAQPLAVVVERVQQAAKDEGRTPPSPNTVARAYRRLPPEFRRIAVHGPHAAKAGALRHGAVAATLPMEWLSLDFTELPILVRAQGKTERGFVKPGAVLITDWFSGVIVGYQLVDPSLRARTGSYVTEDVHAALCGVLYPEFSMAACAAYSGSLPMGIRFDRATMHNEVRALAAYGVQIPNLPGYTPHRNGKVEATHQVVKRLVDRLVGSTQRWRIIDAEAVLTGTAKKPATAWDADNLKRREPERWRLPCRLEDLPSFPEFAAAFDDMIAEFNHEEVREGPAGGVTTRHHRFMAHRQPARLRAGSDGYPLLEVLTCKVESRGIRFHQIGRLAAVTREGTPFAVGQSVTVRLHPLWAGAFAVMDMHHEFVEPHQEWARRISPAALAYEHNQARRAARQRVEAAQDSAMREQLGDVAAVVNQELAEAEQRGVEPDVPLKLVKDEPTGAVKPRTPAKPSRRAARRSEQPSQTSSTSASETPSNASVVARIQSAAIAPRLAPRLAPPTGGPTVRRLPSRVPVRIPVPPRVPVPGTSGGSVLHLC